MLSSFKNLLKEPYLDTDFFVSQCDKAIYEAIKFKHIALAVSTAKSIERELSKLNNSGINTDSLILKVYLSDSASRKTIKFSIYPNLHKDAASITGKIASFTFERENELFVNPELLNIYVRKFEISLKSANEDILSLLLSSELKSFYESVLLDIDLKSKEVIGKSPIVKV